MNRSLKRKTHQRIDIEEDLQLECKQSGAVREAQESRQRQEGALCVCKNDTALLSYFMCFTHTKIRFGGGNYVWPKILYLYESVFL